MSLPWEKIDPLIEMALAEDIGSGDVTSERLIEPQTLAMAFLQAKARGIVAGLPVAERVFRRLDAELQWQPRVTDGSRVESGTELVRFTAKARALLAGERTALNFLQRLSGIASLTAAFVEEVRGLQVKILDTRKTLPGWRQLDKYAVRMGGGANHRSGLWDAILIKENHLCLVGTISRAVERARCGPPLSVEVEVTSLPEAEEALAAGADVLLLDNMSIEEMKRVVKLARGRALIEASGGITLERVRSVAETGVDRISIGALTHSAPALDIAMYIENSVNQP